MLKNLLRRLGHFFLAKPNELSLLAMIPDFHRRGCNSRVGWYNRVEQ
jgi:hypothetical protein